MPLPAPLLGGPASAYESATRPRRFTATVHTLRTPRIPAAAVTLISATILTKDSAAHLDEVLAALQWCDEVVVLDTGSTDETMAIAQRHPNVQLYRLEG